MTISPGKRKVCVVITARPSYARIKTALLAIVEDPNLELQLVVAASALLDRYGNTIRNIEKDGFEIAARVYFVLEGENLVTSAKSVGLGMVELATALDNLKPDLVVTIADRYETLATAAAAANMNIPLVHVQGGEITGSIDDKVRHAVTKFANLHFVATNGAAERVIRMGEDPSTVFVTGCPSIDLAAAMLKNSDNDFDLFEKYGGVGPVLDISNGYLVVLQHSVTTEYKQALGQVTNTLHAVHDLGMPVLWFWPNVDAGSDNVSRGIRAFRENESPKNIHLFKNMLPEDFLSVVYKSRCVIGNSSVGIRECSFLGVPAVNIGSRQNGRERGTNVTDVEYDRDKIGEAVKVHLNNGRPASDMIYGDGKAGTKIAKLLAECELRIEKRMMY